MPTREEIEARDNLINDQALTDIYNAQRWLLQEKPHDYPSGDCDCYRCLRLGWYEQEMKDRGLYEVWKNSVIWMSRQEFNGTA